MIRPTDLSLVLAIGIVACCSPSIGNPPRMLFQDTIVVEDAAAAENSTEQRMVRSCAIIRLPDGSFAFYDRLNPESGPIELPGKDGRMHVLLPYIPQDVLENDTILNSGILKNTQVLRTGSREITKVFVKGEKLDTETAARVGLPRYLDVWMQQASATGVTKPKMIWRGYNGSQIEYQQMPSGRILVPFGSFQPHATPVPPNGRHKTVIQYSDDNGATWQESPTRLVSPCYAGFNGLNEGACEPSIERLRDGRIWMLMRTQAGFLYESFSADDGATWQPARASRFNTSTGPPCIMRHRDGRLVVCWNHCEMPPRANGDGVYGGRDALHIAISDDDGRTWSGFREIYLDHRRNGNPAKSGDRGTAYPLAAFTSDGKIAVISGQGKGGRNVIIVDPDWITEAAAETDFSNGLSDWSVYLHHGPAERWWRARSVGCELISSPTDESSKCLHVRHQSDLPPDGATWNFPNGWIGSSTVRIMRRKGCRGGSIAFNDRMFDPSNDYGEQFAVFRLNFEPDGIIGDVTLEPEHWHDVTFRWDLSKGECRVSVDGRAAATLSVLNPTLNGLSYIRFRSVDDETNEGGFLIDRVSVAIDDNRAPAWSAQEQLDHERRYVDQVVPTWPH